MTATRVALAKASDTARTNFKRRQGNAVLPYACGERWNIVNRTNNYCFYKENLNKRSIQPYGKSRVRPLKYLVNILNLQLFQHTK